jgi:hypothetical protein
MKRITRLIPIFLLFVLAFRPDVKGQELFCTVNIDHNQIQGDKQVFRDMQQAISQYLNFNKWSNDEFMSHERIKCNLQIIVTQRPAPDQFVCTANLQIFRPVLNSTYETRVANLSDKTFNFTYIPFQELRFNTQGYEDNLTALLNFYAFMILGLDYDSFAPNGGNPFYAQAQNIVNFAVSSAQQRGWRSGESTRNRFWLVENLQNNSYKSFRNILYKYHRTGLDQMESNMIKGRQAIMECIRDLNKLNNQFPMIMLPRVFLDSKSDELVGVFSTAFINDKQEFIEIMTELDPSNLNKYNAIMKQE